MSKNKPRENKIETPPVIKSLTSKQLNDLASFLDSKGSDVFELLTGMYVQVNSEELYPTGKSLDYYYWGHKHGSLGVHRFYGRLKEFVEHERKRRVDEEKKTK